MSSTIDDQIEFCPQFFTNLPEYYETGDLVVKRQIIGLIYPEKLVFKNNSFQTNRKHAAIPLICWTGAGFSDPKNGMASKNGSHSNVVNPGGMFSSQLREDLRRLARFKLLIYSN